jgi:hypothetical protein
MTRFRVGAESVGKWLNLGDISRDGTHLYVKFDREQGMIVKRIIPEHVVEQAVKDNRYRAEENKKGTLLRGGTQHHWLPLCSLPAALDDKWQQEIGNPNKDPDSWKAWKKRLNDSQYRDLRTSEYRL